MDLSLPEDVIGYQEGHDDHNRKDDRPPGIEPVMVARSTATTLKLAGKTIDLPLDAWL